MSTTAMTPPSTAPSFNSISYENAKRDPLPKLQTDCSSSSTSHTSSPESRPVDLQSPIPEEEEDETSSETANEPVTPTDGHQPHMFQDRINGATKHDQDSPHTLRLMGEAPPLILNTQATPPPSVPSKKGNTSPAEPQTPKTPIQRRPTSSSKDSHIKRAMSGLFRRSNSHGAHLEVRPLSSLDGNVVANSSDPVFGREQHRLSIRRMSAANSVSNSPSTTLSNTPQSPGSPVETEQPKSRAQLLQVQEPSKDEFFSGRKKNRASTGFSLRDRLSRHKISSSDKDGKRDHERHRATSVDLDSPSHHPHRLRHQDQRNDSNAKLPERAVWALPAETGIGLKSRRMSLSLPDDFTVDVAELYSEYTDQSKLVGRRGKSIGKGATSKVKLMYRRGTPGEVYAVKEFRGKSSNEKAEDYEQKVKSEYSIAKSVHHPNIVESFRLCTHNGRWNHVMEYCEHGDLFNIVSQKYLSRDERLNDRLCLFKQLLQGIHYLHGNGIAHRDVKLENLLVTKDSKLKITDFGVSEVFAGIHPGLRAAGGQCGKDMGEIRLCAPGMCGSPPYVAPEVLGKKGEYDPRPLDVWGAAIVMLTMTSNGCLWSEAKPGSSPLYDDLVRGWNKWNDKHADEVDPVITETDYPHVAFFDQMINPPALRRILLTMLNPDPSKRATIASIAKNRWVKNIECCQIDSYDDPTTMIDASVSSCTKNMNKVVWHNHLPPSTRLGHKLVRLPGANDM
ncbi:Protein kinase-like (PK-like) [Venustampulla echinocandica]|uniref:Protein kinase-like (PK-like) n=1 Tax=Venustampulla echinocandica TaxID=2656787 RepID=A0A370U135_9HELO|nr:Protein kinase-like (PK-like) [Venustampulla echinocandica]RDL41484.1 Protein kinase-like (PK-like) [Venustampulla echinocandica]